MPIVCPAHQNVPAPAASTTSNHTNSALPALRRDRFWLR